MDKLYKINYFLLNNSNNNIIFNKNHIIIQNYVGKLFFIYNGKQFTKLMISNKMVGFKFGEFLNTRKKHIYTKIKKKK